MDAEIIPPKSIDISAILLWILVSGGHNEDHLFNTRINTFLSLDINNKFK